MTSYSPLFDPAKDGPVFTRDVARARERARETLAEKGRANIHSQDEMIQAAYGLAHVLAGLLNALDEEAGR
ncbi:hypothetical protein ABZ705_01030 [Streptomyces sp. NPDC006984]|uniref:hypothetical protein n=1 Tax=Streptomyces sp. NPDC006984 TaxID=3155463 RepID=UPI0033ED7A7C